MNRRSLIRILAAASGLGAAVLPVGTATAVPAFAAVDLSVAPETSAFESEVPVVRGAPSVLSVHVPAASETAPLQREQLNIRLTLEAVDGPVRNIRVVSDKVPDASSAEALVLALTAGLKTDEEKALAIWEYLWRNLAIIQPRWHEQEQVMPGGQTDPTAVINGYGYDLCSDMSMAQTVLCRLAGLPARWGGIREIEGGGHSPAEVYFDGAWHYVDPIYHNIQPSEDFETIAGLEELHNKPHLFLRAAIPYFSRWRYPEWGFSATLADQVGNMWKTYDHGLQNTHRALINLREGERLVRTWRSDGRYLPAGFYDGPSDAFPYCATAYGGPAYTFGLATLSQEIDFARGEKALENFRLVDNLRLADGRLEVADSSSPGVLLYAVDSVYPTLSCDVSVAGIRADENARISLSYSTDDGATFTPVIFWEEYPAIDNIQVKSRLAEPLYFKYRVLYRIELTGSAAVRRMSFSTDAQLNPRALPALEAGENKVVVCGTGPAEARLSVGYETLTDTAIGVSKRNICTGDTVTVIARIRNTGDKDASDVKVAFYDRHPSVKSATPFATTIVPRVPAGGEAVASVEWATMGESPRPFAIKGSRDLVVVVDPDNTVVETDEDNNLALNTGLVLMGPDLVTTPEYVRLDRTPGGYTAKAVIYNYGERPARDVRVELIAHGRTADEFRIAEIGPFRYAVVRVPVVLDRDQIVIGVRVSMPDYVEGDESEVIHEYNADNNKSHRTFILQKDSVLPLPEPISRPSPSADASSLRADEHTLLLARCEGTADAEVAKGDLANHNKASLLTQPDGGRFGQAARFGLTYAAPGNFSPEAGTIEFWARIDFDLEPYQYQEVFLWRCGSFGIDKAVGRQIRGQFWPEGVSFYEPRIVTYRIPDTWREGEWHHFALTWSCREGGEKPVHLALFVDGERQGEAQFEGLPGPKPAEYIQFAKPCTFDDIRISDVERTPEEIARSAATG